MRMLFFAMGGMIAAIVNFFVWFGLASLSSDPTSGGAYCAMMMLTAIPVSIVGAILSAEIFNRAN